MPGRALKLDFESSGMVISGLHEYVNTNSSRVSFKFHRPFVGFKSAKAWVWLGDMRVGFEVCLNSPKKK